MRIAYCFASGDIAAVVPPTTPQPAPQLYSLSNPFHKAQRKQSLLHCDTIGDENLLCSGHIIHKSCIKSSISDNWPFIVTKQPNAINCLPRNPFVPGAAKGGSRKRLVCHCFEVAQFTYLLKA